MHGSLLLADPGGVLILAAITAAVAGLMRGFAGFGSAILMAPVFAVLLGPVHMVPMVAAVELPMSMMLFLGARRDVDWRFVAPLSAIAMIAIARAGSSPESLQTSSPDPGAPVIRTTAHAAGVGRCGTLRGCFLGQAISNIPH